MVFLDFDCLSVVFDHLEPETRTLYNCLFVSKTFFHASVRVLYRRPLKVFEGQREISPFSKNHLANLLGICSGFIQSPPFTPLKAPLPTTNGKQQQQASSLSQSPSTLPVATAFTSTSKQHFRESVSTFTTLVDQPTTSSTILASTISTTTTTPATTINYSSFVIEYPDAVIASKNYTRWQENLTTHAETIPILRIYTECLDFILPLVSRFRVLHTIYFYAHQEIPYSYPPNGEFGPTDMAKIVRLIESHVELFPGVLKQIPIHDMFSSLNEYMMVVKAMGGVKDCKVLMQRETPVQPDLNQLQVSKLKKLELRFQSKPEDDYFVNLMLTTNAMELLKRCKSLEELDVNWIWNLEIDWSLFLKEEEEEMEKHENQKRKLSSFGDDGGEQKSQINPTKNLSASSSKSVIKLQQSHGQQRPLFKLKHLAVWMDPSKSIKAMKFFSETLESFEVGYDRNTGYRSHGSPYLDWRCSFTLPKLKSLGVRNVNLCIQNLVSCPALDTLILCSARLTTNLQSWPDINSMRSVLLPRTLKKLELLVVAANNFDLEFLKPLIHLEHLRLDGYDLFYDDSRYKPGSMINMSSIKREKKTANGIDWFFPQLKHVMLSGRFAFQIQGQILWVAPLLEYLSLDLLLYRSDSCALDTDTFLYPPREIDFDSVGKQNAKGVIWGTTLPALSTTASTASFLSLKTLKLKSFLLPKFRTADAFGKVFFSRRESQQSSPSDGSDGCEIIDDMTRYLFPNLEQLEFYWKNNPHHYLQPCVLRAMKSMPKLEHILYTERTNKTRYEPLANWLQQVPDDNLGKQHKNYRHRPSAAEGSTLSSSKKETGNSRCVVEFNFPPNVRYQLNPRTMGRVKATGTRVLKHMFSAL